MGWNGAAAQVVRTADPEIMSVVSQWRALQQSDGLGFSAYASFLLAHPDWPGEDRLRRLAETSINPNSIAPVQVIEFFTRYAPRTATGHARFALALSVVGRMADAQAEARLAWRNGGLSPYDETQLISMFGPSFTSDDYAARVDALLWQRNPSSAMRYIGWLSPSQRPLAEARIAMQQGAGDAVTKMQMAEPYGAGDPGFIADKVSTLRDQGNSYAARNSLAQRRTLTKRPFNVEKWFELMLSSARAAESDGQFQLAYDIASKVDDAYDPDVNIRYRPIGERDDYTSLVWLAGMNALERTGRPRDAIGMFERYASAARSPQTISKGFYWAGRAAVAANDMGMANRFFGNAAAYPDQFHGQLALERLGRAVPSPAEFALSLPPLSQSEKEAFDKRSIVRAAKALNANGYRQEESTFIRAIAANVQSEKDRVAVIELSRKLGRPDLGVMVGRRALSTGQSGYTESSFPSLPVPSGHEHNYTMIHAITRQESQFDRAAVSHAGARGLMQLMPGTARETAGKIGLAYMAGSLTTDPQYNIQLGSTYFQSVLNYFGGSYPLAVAAYNAGPGNVNKWLARNGDPRLPGGDIVEWIENIPLSETRNYVQRVLENAVVYDTIRPGTARFRGPNALSRYLGKNTPG
jgi:soluble lytic murein transglycosylase